MGKSDVLGRLKCQWVHLKSELLFLRTEFAVVSDDREFSA